MSASALLEPTERVPIRESALAWIDNRGIRLEMITPEQLFDLIHDDLFDRDVLSHACDLTDSPF
jgi:hypothetical protein